VVKDVPPGGVVVGTPAEPQRDFMARVILPKTVAKLKSKIEELERKLSELSRKETP
jgi:UDP-3-O-[3-hydroxymyristoyl] glucosamine N-acyltransferase